MHIEEMPLAPGGKGLFGHNADFRNDRMGVLNKLARAKEPIMRLKLPVPGVAAVVVNDPDLVHEVLVEHGRIFHKSAMLRFALYPLAGEGLFTANGQLWQRQRKLMAPMFQPHALESYATDMVTAALRTVDKWRNGDHFELLHETTRMAMSVAGKTLFDADTFSEADEIGRALTIALSWTGWMMGRPFAIAHLLARRSLLNWRPRLPHSTHSTIDSLADAMQGPLFLAGKRGRELAQAIKLLDARVQRMIDERRQAETKPGDLLSRLLTAHDDDDSSKMSDRQVRDEVLTLFIAGHETTATGLAWALYLVSRNPEVRTALEKEVDALDGDPKLADLPRLGLCLRVFQEALRLYPPVYMFGRDSTERVTVGGYELPLQTNVLISPWALHHNERIWPKPDVFDPDRFLPKAEAERHRYAYLPFGAGPRICIGNHFAYMEAQLALAIFLRRFRFESLEKDEPLPEATLRPRGGIPVRVVQRN